MRLPRPPFLAVRAASKISSESLPSAAEVATVNKYVKKRGLSLVPTSIFRRSVALSLFKMTRPPTKRHLGTKTRVIKPVPCNRVVWDELTSTARGMATESAAEGVLREAWSWLPQQKDARALAATKTTSARRLTKLKLQRQDNVAALCSFEKTFPATGLGATRVILKKVAPHEYTVKAVCMASQLSLSHKEPQGKAATERFATLEGKMNVVTMSAVTAEIHFGVINYPPWMMRYLRWEMYDSVLLLAARGSMKVPFSQELLDKVEELQGDRSVAREPRWEELA